FILESLVAEIWLQQQSFEDRPASSFSCRNGHQFLPTQHLLDKGLERLSSEAVAIIRRSHSNILVADLDQIIFQSGLIFDVAFLFSPFHLVQGRLSDKQMAFLN